MNQDAKTLYPYFLVEGKMRGDSFNFNLSYSGESGDGVFPLLCADILCELLEKYWVNMLIEDSDNQGFQFPRLNSRGEDCFSDAVQQYLNCDKMDATVLFGQRGHMMVLSRGVQQTILRAYLSDLSPNFPIRHTRLYGYGEPPQFDGSFEGEKAKLEGLDWAIMADYGELQDNIDILIRDPSIDITAVRSSIQQICGSYERNIQMVSLPDPSCEQGLN